jgi:hypothetical protein
MTDLVERYAEPGPDIVIDSDDDASVALATMRHSTAHLMAEAVRELYPDVRFAIGPAIENGFYYDMELSHPLTPEDLVQITEVMERHRSSAEPFEREEISREVALELFADNPYKTEIIRALADDSTITTYTQGDFVDLCKGPHVGSTGDIGPFRLLSVAGAYWRGDEKRPMLPTDLRDRLPNPGRARSTPISARGGTAARPSTAGTRVGPLLGQRGDRPRTDPVAPEGRHGPLPGGALRAARAAGSWIPDRLYAAHRLPEDL